MFKGFTYSKAEIAPYFFEFKPAEGETRSLSCDEHNLVQVVEACVKCINSPVIPLSEKGMLYDTLVIQLNPFLESEEDSPQEVAGLIASLASWYTYTVTRITGFAEGGFFYVSCNNDDVVNEDDTKKLDIQFTYITGKPLDQIPDEQLELHGEIEKTISVIRTMKGVSLETKKMYIAELGKVAQQGLTFGQTAGAEKDLELLRQRIHFIESPKIKHDYMVKLGIWSLLFILMSVIAYSVTVFGLKITWPAPYIIVFGGTMLGTWLSFGSRSVSLAFEQLGVMEKDMMSPLIRLLYIGLCSVCLLLLLNCGVITITIAGKTTFTDSQALQLSFGVICGFLESKIGVELYNKVRDIVDDKDK